MVARSSSPLLTPYDQPGPSSRFCDLSPPRKPCVKRDAPPPIELIPPPSPSSSSSSDTEEELNPLPSPVTSSSSEEDLVDREVITLYNETGSTTVVMEPAPTVDEVMDDWDTISIGSDLQDLGSPEQKTETVKDIEEFIKETATTVPSPSTCPAPETTPDPLQELMEPGTTDSPRAQQGLVSPTDIDDTPAVAGSSLMMTSPAITIEVMTTDEATPEGPQPTKDSTEPPRKKRKPRQRKFRERTADGTIRRFKDDQQPMDM